MIIERRRSRGKKRGAWLSVEFYVMKEKKRNAWFLVSFFVKSKRKDRVPTDFHSQVT